MKFRSDIAVRLVDELCCGWDQQIAHAAWVVPPPDPDAWNPEKDMMERHGKDDTEAGWRQVIRAMMKARHRSPFEKGCMEVYIEAPGVVWWQLTRYRFMSLETDDLSPNIESGRYRVLEGEFYVPPDDRPCREPEGFKPMRPELVADGDLAAELSRNIRNSAADAWLRYAGLIEQGVAREVARLALPNWALYCRGYVGARPLTWLHFFAQRKRGGDVPTFPQWEIEQLAEQVEALFAQRWPITHAAFVENGRVAP